MTIVGVSLWAKGFEDLTPQMKEAITSRLNSETTGARPAEPCAARRAGSVMSACRAWASSLGDSGGTNAPLVPSQINSGIADTLVATQANA